MWGLLVVTFWSWGIAPEEFPCFVYADWTGHLAAPWDPAAAVAEPLILSFPRVSGLALGGRLGCDVLVVAHCA